MNPDCTPASKTASEISLRGALTVIALDARNRVHDLLFGTFEPQDVNVTAADQCTRYAVPQIGAPGTRVELRFA